MNIIYKDVEIEILSFLLNSRSMINVSLINKRWNHLFKKSKFWEIFLLLKENLQMLKEDGDNYLNNCLIEEWGKYTKWLYPINDFSLETGDYVDVLDNINVWGSGIIKDIIFVSDDKENKACVSYEKKFMIEFLGWNDSFNEVVNIDKIQPFGTKTLNNKKSNYLYLQKLDNNHWVFFKKNGKWNKEKIKFCEKNKDNLTFYIANSFEILNKKDIQEKIKPCTNVFALLCNNRFENLNERDFLN